MRPPSSTAPSTSSTAASTPSEHSKPGNAKRQTRKRGMKMDKAAFANSYSLPIGPGSMYAPPPYLYRGVEDCFIVYETEAAGVEALLPPGLEISDEVPTCIAW